MKAAWHLDTAHGASARAAAPPARSRRYLAFAMTRPKISKSERIILRNSSEVFPTGIDLMSLMRLRTIEDRMAWATAALIFSKMSGGVLAATMTANQVLLSNPGRPDSASVGTSGTLGSRFGPATASTRIL